MRFERGVLYAQCYGSRFAVQIGTWVLRFWEPWPGYAARIEICTPKHWIRFSRAKRDRAKEGT